MRRISSICLSLMALTSFSALSQESNLRKLEIQNLTYPEKSMTLECEDLACNLMKFTLKDASDDKDYYIVKKNTVESTSINRRRKGTGARFYGGTKDLSALASKRYEEAYYGKAVGNSILTGLAVIGDTLVLPIDVIESLFSKNALDSRRDKKGAQRILGNLNSDIEKVVIKHKYYEQIESYIRDSFPFAKSNADYEVLKDFSLGVYENCSLKSYSYNQRYTEIEVDGYKLTTEYHPKPYSYEGKSSLLERLESLVKEGSCIKAK